MNLKRNNILEFDDDKYVSEKKSDEDSTSNVELIST